MNASPETVFLIDGSAFLYRAFHAIQHLSTTEGHPTNATYGVTRILMKLIREKIRPMRRCFSMLKAPPSGMNDILNTRPTGPPCPMRWPFKFRISTG